MSKQLARRSAFTLVELLVVIGIIALLIAILLPSLSRARQQSLRTACSAKMHQMMIAAELHRSDHHGYYPLAGVLPDCTPSDLINDTAAIHYSYLSYTIGAAPRQLAPITDSLAGEMGYKKQLGVANNTDALQFMLDPNGFSRNFLCPAQANVVTDVAPVNSPGAFDMLYYATSANSVGAYSEPQSYVYNEAVLGYNDSLARLRGQAGRVRQPSMTMFAANGLHGKFAAQRENVASNIAMDTLYNNTAIAPVTMGGAFIGNIRVAGDPACFDINRHQGKLNVAFCDGHVETRSITFNDLNTIFLLAP